MVKVQFLSSINDQEVTSTINNFIQSNNYDLIRVDIRRVASNLVDATVTYETNDYRAPLRSGKGSRKLYD